MPKLKTHKATAKRIKIKKSGKLMRRTAGQDHFNAKESGKVRRNKRSDQQVSKSLEKTIKRIIPYNKQTKERMNIGTNEQVKVLKFISL